MTSVKTVLYLGICLSAGIITTADENAVPKAENVRWVSLDFKTVLTWTTKASNHKYTVMYSSDDGDWRQSPDCIRVSESECDLSNYLIPFDRTYSADIQTEPATLDYDYDLEEYPHTYSPHFNPYRERLDDSKVIVEIEKYTKYSKENSNAVINCEHTNDKKVIVLGELTHILQLGNISAVNFTVEAVGESRVTVNITDPLTSIHERGKQLSIRDVLKKDLKYKISYYKSGSTGKRDIISDSSTAEVSKLDAGQSYCFMVAAFIPSRPQTTQLGAWSIQQCTPGDGNILQELSFGAWVALVFILPIVLIIIITVTVLCCKCCRQRNTSQSSAPV